MSEEEHPCESLSKGGMVCKVDIEGNVYCTVPNGCGIVSRQLFASPSTHEGTILVQRTSFRREEDKLRVVGKRTERIMLSRWNSFEHLTCCADEDFWSTNIPLLNVPMSSH